MSDDQKQPETTEPDTAELDRIKAQNEKLVGEIRALSEKLKAFGDLTPETAAEAAKKARDLEEAQLTAAGQFDELKKRLQAEHKSEAEKLRQAVEERDAKLNRLLVQDALDRALDAVGVLPSRKEFVRRYFLAEAPKVSGDAAVVTTATGDTPLADYVAQWAKSDEADPFIESRAKSGSGSRNGDTRGAPKKWETMSDTERAALHRSDPDAWRRLAREAGLAVR